MREYKHSPAPWEIVPVDYGDETICLVPAYVKAADGRTVVSRDGGLAPVDDEWTEEEIKANAALVVAAPEMYEALKAVEDLLPRIFEWIPDYAMSAKEWAERTGEVQRQIDAALVKADGRG